MALPKLNIDAPSYSLTVPSTKKTINYRPFLVKEQRNLLIALESKDPKMVLNAVLTCIESCSPNINASKLSTFDVDYMFTQIRGKSVGETTNILSECTECEHEHTINLNLDDIKIDHKHVDNVIPITENINIVMKYPTYDDLLKNDSVFNEDKSAVELLFETIISCIDSVQTEDENISLKDEPRAEVEAFINSLTSLQLEKLSLFVDAMPSLEHTIDYVCESCNHANTLTLKGIQDFF